MEFKTNSVEGAFVATGRNPSALPGVSHLPEHDRQNIIDDYKLKVVVEAINTESNDGKPWKPNYNDLSEKKWELVFVVQADEEHPSGFGLSGARYDCWDARTAVGSRLVFHSKLAGMHAFKIVPDLFVSVFLSHQKQQA